MVAVRQWQRLSAPLGLGLWRAVRHGSRARPSPSRPVAFAASQPSTWGSPTALPPLAAAPCWWRLFRAYFRGASLQSCRGSCIFVAPSFVATAASPTRLARPCPRRRRGAWCPGGGRAPSGSKRRQLCLGRLCVVRRRGSSFRGRIRVTQPRCVHRVWVRARACSREGVFQRPRVPCLNLC